MKKTLFALLITLCGMNANAQSDGYYTTVQGLRQSELKTALWRLVQPDYVPAYGGKGEGYTWWGFTQTDVMADGSVRDRYSANRYQFNGLKAVAGMNIEHSFANSWWGHTVNNAYCDLFNLFPSDAEANGRKSNNPIGVVDAAVSYDNGVTRVGRSTSYRPDSLITVWEPADEWKGDFARTYFYMATCYQDYTDLWTTTEGLLMVEPGSYPTLRPWVLSLLLDWNRQDPVSDIESERNDLVQVIQGNRNPFVDYPQLAEYIWGDSIDTRFYITAEDGTELFVPQENEVFDFGRASLSRGLTASLRIRGRGWTQKGVLTNPENNIELGRSQFDPDEVADGLSVPVTFKPTGAGPCEATITIQADGFKRQCSLIADFIDGLPAYDATDIVCSVNSKRFTASWMNWGEGETYTLDVRKNGASLSGYPVEVSDTCAIVSGVSAATTYTYRVTASDGTQSNEVTVTMPAVTPVFSANSASMMFTATPDCPSRPQTLTVTAIEVPKYETLAETTAPFEISADGETWSQSATLKGSSQTLYVRLGATLAEGAYEGELVLSTEGVGEIVVTLTAEVDASKAFFENFEGGSKNAYSEGTVTASATTWNMANALIGTDANDSKNDERAVRIRVQSATPNEVTMQEDFEQGCDSLWFWAGPYNKDTGVKLSVFYSVDKGETWVPVVEEMALANATWKRYGYELAIGQPLRLRFVGSGSNSKRINLDDIQMSAPAGNLDAVAVPASVCSPDDMVGVYTTSGVCVRYGRRDAVTRNLPKGLYIIK